MLFTSIKADRKVRSLDGTSRLYCSRLYSALIKSSVRHYGHGWVYIGDIEGLCSLVKPYLPYCDIYLRVKTQTRRGVCRDSITLFHYSQHIYSNTSIIYKRMKVKIGMVRVKYFKGYYSDMEWDR